MNVEETCKKRGWNISAWLQKYYKWILSLFGAVAVIANVAGGIMMSFIENWLNSAPSIPQQIR